MKQKQKPIYILFAFLFWAFAACTPTQNVPYYVPATEALVVGNSHFCGDRIMFTITKISETTIEAKATCQSENTNGWGGSEWFTTSEATFTAPKTQKILTLLNVTKYNWGVIVDDEGNLLQIYEQGSSGSAGLVHIHWPPPPKEEG